MSDSIDSLLTQAREAWRRWDYDEAATLLEKGVALSRKRAHKRDPAFWFGILGDAGYHPQRDYRRAASICERSTALSHELGDKVGRFVSTHSLGRLLWRLGEHARAMLVLKESYALGQELGDKLGIGYSRYTLGLLARTQGDYAQAVALHEDALPLFREVGDNGGIASVLNSLGLIAQAQGEYSRAAALHRESLSIFKELGDERGIALALYSWARAAFRQGDNDRGMVLCTESLALRRKTEDLLGIAECFEVLALVVTQAQQQRAVRLFATAEALRVAIGAPIPASDRAERDSALANLRRALGDAAFATAWAEGEDLTPEQAVAFASQQSRSNA